MEYLTTICPKCAPGRFLPTDPDNRSCRRHMWRGCIESGDAKVYINGVLSTTCTVVQVWGDTPQPQPGLVQYYVLSDAPHARNTCDCMQGEPPAVLYWATVQVVLPEDGEVAIVPGNNLGIDPGVWCWCLPDDNRAQLDARRDAYQEIANARRGPVQAPIGAHVELFTPEDV